MNKPLATDSHCRRCGATDVYWMSVWSREEANYHFQATGNRKALDLAKPRLFNLSGGEHVCPLNADDFAAEPTQGK